jgi:homoserine dehydrogenase
MQEPLGVALIGCGTVGSGVARVLLEHGERLADRAGRPLVLRRVLVRDPHKERPVKLPPGVLTTDLRQVLHDPTVHVAAELVGGTEECKEIVLQLLAAGKDVVTANKALLAQHGIEVFDRARRHGRAIAFEPAVGGGMPIIAALTHSLAANQIVALRGILNGTCNFILTGMTETGRSYNEALAEAQRHGYAEADPTLDVDGTDAAHKLAILAQIAFGVQVAPGAIDRRGIAQVQALDIQYAGELGYTIKLLAEAYRLPCSRPSPVEATAAATSSACSRPSPVEATAAANSGDNQLALHVSPVLLRRHDPLAQVRGAYNAVHVVGDILGDALFYGQGAGAMPTASAVVSDLIDLAIDRGHRLFQTRRLWNGSRTVVLRPAETVRTRFYLRLRVQDRPGVLAEVARVLAQHEVSIASVIQHEAADAMQGQWVQLVIMTHTAPTGTFRAAAGRMEQLDSIAPPAVYYPVGD